MAESRSQKTLIIAAGTGIQAVLTHVALNFVLVRLLDSQEAFGIYRQAWLVVTTAAPVFLFGLDASLYYFFPSLRSEHRRGFLARTMGFLFLSGTFLAVLMALASSGIARLFSAPEVAPLIRALGIYAAFGIPSTMLFQFLISDDRAVRAVIYNVVILVVQTTIIAVMIALGYSFETVFYALGVFSFLRCSQAVFEMARLTRGSWRARPPVTVRSHLAYAFPVGMTATVAMLGGRLDKFVVASFLDPATYGLYSIGAMEFPLVPLLVSAVATVLRISVSKLHHEGRVNEIVILYRNAFRKTALVLLPMGICLALFAREVMTVLYTADYADAADVFRIFLVLILPRLAPLEPMLASLGATRVLLLGGIWFLGVDLVLNLIGVRWLGVLGPPAATVVATAALALFYGAFTARRLGLRLRALYPAPIVLPVLLVSAAAAAAAAPAKLLPWPAVSVLGVGVGIFVLVFTAVGFLSRTVRKDDLGVFGGVEAWIRRTGRTR